MKRMLLVLVVGFAFGALTHIGFYSVRHPVEESKLAQNLVWMKQYFGLSDVQYERIRALHDHTGPELQRLFNVLRATSTELTRLEEVRRNTDSVDFLGYHQTAEENRRARRQCQALTLDLVYAVAEVMSPAQRTLYFDLVGNGIQLSQPLPRHT